MDDSGMHPLQQESIHPLEQVTSLLKRYSNTMGETSLTTEEKPQSRRTSGLDLAKEGSGPEKAMSWIEKQYSLFRDWVPDRVAKGL